MASQIEEIFVTAYFINAQHLAPNLCHGFLCVSFKKYLSRPSAIIALDVGWFKNTFGYYIQLIRNKSLAAFSPLNFPA